MNNGNDPQITSNGDGAGGTNRAKKACSFQAPGVVDTWYG